MLLEALIRERETEKTKFFQQLADDIDLPIEGVTWGPIQQVFKQNLRESLLAY